MGFRQTCQVQYIVDARAVKPTLSDTLSAVYAKVWQGHSAFVGEIDCVLVVEREAVLWWVDPCYVFCLSLCKSPVEREEA